MLLGSHNFFRSRQNTSWTVQTFTNIPSNIKHFCKHQTLSQTSKHFDKHQTLPQTSESSANIKRFCKHQRFFGYYIGNSLYIENIAKIQLEFWEKCMQFFVLALNYPRISHKPLSRVDSKILHVVFWNFDFYAFFGCANLNKIANNYYFSHLRPKK